MIRIIGGGLAGCEAAWQVASAGLPVTLYEMRPQRGTAVHKTDRLAELVCSNSFRGDQIENAVGLLKEEMRRLGSLVMRAADATRVPAGAALAVDRSSLGAEACVETKPNSRFKAATSLSVLRCCSSASAAPCASAAASRSAFLRANEASWSSDFFSSWLSTATRSLSRIRCSVDDTVRPV